MNMFTEFCARLLKLVVMAAVEINLDDPEVSVEITTHCKADCIKVADLAVMLGQDVKFYPNGVGVRFATGEYVAISNH